MTDNVFYAQQVFELTIDQLMNMRNHTINYTPAPSRNITKSHRQGFSNTLSLKFPLELLTLLFLFHLF